jgi:DNA-binding response OmpR family regulator
LGTIDFGEIAVDPTARTVRRGGREVALLAKEFDLLLLLAGHPGHPFSRETILDRVWGWGFEGTTRTVDNYILSLRQKLEADPAHPRHIVTVRQVGYRLDF